MYALHQFPSLFKTNLQPQTLMSSIIFVNSIQACIILETHTILTKKLCWVNSLKDFHIVSQFRDGCNVALGRKMKHRQS